VIAFESSFAGVIFMSGHAGLDRSEFPGAHVMTWLKANTNLEWCGYYLAPSPSHSGTSWMGHRNALLGEGWGIAPLYVGQQVIGPGSHHPSQHQGQVDGREAVTLLADEGFPAGTCVYLDLENGLPFPQALRDYVASWSHFVQAQNFTPGIYCSHSFAEDVHVLVPSARLWVFKVTTTAPHPIPGPHFPDNHPAGSGYAGAFIWQLGQNCRISLPGSPVNGLGADFDSAVSPNPGS
jgi:hypothetical protein